MVRLTDEELKELEAPPKPPAPTVKKESKAPIEKAPPKPKLSVEEVLRRDRWERVIDMIQKGRLDALDSFFARRQEEQGPEGADEWLKGRVPLGVGHEPGWTLLHIAAAADQPEIVERLLVGRRLNPTHVTSTSTPSTEVSQDVDADAQAPIHDRPSGPARTAYEVAPSRATRNVFRRAMASHPDWWDWSGDARVPSALTEEMEAAQAGKGKDRKARLKEKVKERDREREKERVEQERQEAVLAAQQEAEKQRLAASTAANGRGPKKPQKVGGPAAAVARKRNETETAGLSEEQKMRLERERRARAAEARLAGPS